MASILKKKIKGKNYYYYVVGKRIDGKVKLIRQKYLGTAENIVRLMEEKENIAKEVDHFAFGEVATLWNIASKHNLVQIINTHSLKDNTVMEPGKYLVLAAINRCVKPSSKNGIKKWYRKTVLPELLKIPENKVKSQDFWEAMDCFDEEALEKIEEEIIRSILKTYPVPLDLALYDTTNFFTFMNEATSSTLAQRGHNKDGKHHLRQIGLALCTTKDFGLPLLHQVFEGNMHDCKLFPGVVRKVIHRLFNLTKKVEKITFIFDKGNNSKKNFTFLEEKQISFVGSLVPAHHKDLLKIPLEEYEEILLESGVSIKAKRMTKKVFGKERTIVITFNQALQRKQTLSLEKRIQKSKEELEQINWKRVKNLKKKRDEILGKRKICGLLKVVKRKDKFSIERNPSLISKRMLSVGKNILFTDRDDLTTKEIISLYKDKCEVEECFKRLKDNTHISFTPPYHWTDSKIRVQAFICVLALILLKLLKLEAHLHGINMSIPLLLEELHDIREIVMLSQHGKVIRKISKCSPNQKRLFLVFDLEKITKELDIQPPYP